MAIDYYTCKHCGETFPDVNDYVSCDCGEHWCSMECAIEDGYIDEHCLIYANLDYRDTMEDYRNKHDVCYGMYDNCEECPHYAPASCKYCRGEDFDEHELLEYVYRRYMTKEWLIERYKKDKAENWFKEWKDSK